MKRKIGAVFMALLLLMPTALASAQETVVTSFYPIYLFTLNLLKDVQGVALKNLAAPEVGCLHDYQLTTGDMKTLAAANLFIVNGAGMESFLTDAAAQFPDLGQVVATQGMQVDATGNAHLWLTPSGAKEMVQNIAAGLIAALPQSAGQIQSNLAALNARLDTLDEQMAQGLEPLRGKAIITFHEAFPYFAQAYGLKVAAVIEREPGEALSPAQLKELADVIGALDNPPLFIEPQYPDLAARTLSAETGAPVYLLDPIVTGPMDETAPDYYFTVMLKNMETLLDALS